VSAALQALGSAAAVASAGPVGIALALAQFAPSIMRFFGAGESSVGVAQEVVDIAQRVASPNLTPEQLLQRMQQDQELANAFNLAVLSANTDLERAYLADRDSARQRDMALARFGRHNRRADAMFVLAVSVICLIVWVVWSDPNISEFVKGIVTLVLGRFLGYLDNIYNFEFGSTRGSQSKDAIVAGSISPEVLQRILSQINRGPR
jgi:hypothetical protein